MTKLVDDKVKDWKKLGIGNTDSKAKDRNTFLDANYMRSIAKGNVRYAAADFVFNSLIANAEMFIPYIPKIFKSSILFVVKSGYFSVI